MRMVKWDITAKLRVRIRASEGVLTGLAEDLKALQELRDKCESEIRRAGNGNSATEKELA